MPALRPGDRGYTGYGQVRGDPVAPLDPFDGDHYDRQPWDPDDPSVDRRMGDDSEHDDPVEVVVRTPAARPVPKVHPSAIRGDAYEPIQVRDSFDDDEGDPGEDPDENPTGTDDPWWKVAGYASLAAALKALGVGGGGDGSDPSKPILSGDPADPSTPAGALNKVLDVLSGLLGGGDQTQSQQVDIKQLVGDLAQTIGDISNHQEVNIDFEGLAEALKQVQGKGITLAEVTKLLEGQSKGFTDIVSQFVNALVRQGFPDPKDDDDGSSTEAALDKILDTVGKITDLLTAINKAITEGRYFGLTPGERAGRDDASRYPGTTPWERLGAGDSPGHSEEGLQRLHDSRERALDRITQTRLGGINAMSTVLTEYVKQNQDIGSVRQALAQLQVATSGDSFSLSTEDIAAGAAPSALTRVGMETDARTRLTDMQTVQSGRMGWLIYEQIFSERNRSKLIDAQWTAEVARVGLINQQTLNEMYREGLITEETKLRVEQQGLARNQADQARYMLTYLDRDATAKEKQAAAAVFKAWLDEQRVNIEGARVGIEEQRYYLEHDRVAVDGKVYPQLVSSVKQVQGMLDGTYGGGTQAMASAALTGILVKYIPSVLSDVMNVIAKGRTMPAARVKSGGGSIIDPKFKPSRPSGSGAKRGGSQSRPYGQQGNMFPGNPDNSGQGLFDFDLD